MQDFEFRQIEVRLRLDYPVESFSDLLSFSLAMHDIDALTIFSLGFPDRRDFTLLFREGVFWFEPLLLEERLLLGGRARIKSLSVSSPPDLTVLCDPQWVGVFISLVALGIVTVAEYDKLKENVPRIRSDIEELISRLAVRSSKLKQRLRNSAFTFVDELLQISEHEAEFVVRRIQVARQRLRIEGAEIDSNTLQITDPSDERD